jgi:quercetin dioxygenase-like cupin family protein
MFTFTRLYSDRLGQSHFDDVEVHFTPVDRVAGAPPLNLSDITSASHFRFMEAPAGWSSDWHTSSARTLFIVMSGEWEVTVSDGESRRFAIGSAILVEYTRGIGHASRITSVDGSLAAMIELSD